MSQANPGAGSALGLSHVVRQPRAGGPGPHPAIMLVHGRGADANDLLSLADDLDPRLLIIGVHGPIPLGAGFAWYHLMGTGDPDPVSFHENLTRLTDFFQALPKVYPIDPAALYTLGFSQGAVMVGSLLVKHPTGPAGTIMLSGYLPIPELEPIDRLLLANREVFLAHGTQDSVIPIALAREARDFFLKVGADLTYQEYPIGHSISSEEVTDFAGWLRARLTASS